MSDSKFIKLIEDSIRIDDDITEMIYDAFGEDTIDQWLEGKSLPEPNAQVGIVLSICSIMLEKVKRDVQ